MQIVVELNTEREILWGFPGSTKPTLTLACPAIQVDLDKLSNDQRKAIVAGIQAKRLKSSVRPEQIPVEATPVAVAKTVVSQPQLSVAEHVARETQKLQERITKILDGSVQEIKKTVLASKDLKFIREIAAVEAAGKKRATLLKFLYAQVSELSLAVTKSISIQTEAAEVHDPARIEVAGNVIDYEVIDSEETEITLELPERGN